jgi:hypothetical protein
MTQEVVADDNDDNRHVAKATTATKISWSSSMLCSSLSSLSGCAPVEICPRWLSLFCVGQAHAGVLEARVTCAGGGGLLYLFLSLCRPSIS